MAHVTRPMKPGCTPSDRMAIRRECEADPEITPAELSAKLGIVESAVKAFMPRSKKAEKAAAEKAATDQAAAETETEQAPASETDGEAETDSAAVKTPRRRKAAGATKQED